VSITPDLETNVSNKRGPGRVGFQTTAGFNGLKPKQNSNKYKKTPVLGIGCQSSITPGLCKKRAIATGDVNR
jgi:hypothetical protein